MTQLLHEGKLGYQQGLARRSEKRCNPRQYEKQKTSVRTESRAEAAEHFASEDQDRFARSPVPLCHLEDITSQRSPLRPVATVGDFATAARHSAGKKLRLATPAAGFSVVRARGGAPVGRAPVPP